MLNDYKIQDWTNPIINEADRPQRSASDMKAVFDSNSNQLRTALNNLIDALAQSGAEDIGAAVDGMEGQTVETILAELKGLIDSAGENLDDLKAAVMPEGDGSLFLANNGEWKLPSVGAAANGVKAGGDKGYLYVKASDKVYDAEWKQPAELGFLQEGDTVSNADNAKKLGGKSPEEYQEAIQTATATLPLASWAGAQAPYTQEVNVNDVTADDVLIVGGDDGYSAAGVKCTAQAAGKLTFSCESVPEADVTASIVIVRR